MKRTIVILLTLLFTCGLITGCGGGETGGTPSPGAEEDPAPSTSESALTVTPSAVTTAPGVADATPAAVASQTAPPKATSAAVTSPQTANPPASTTPAKTTPAKKPAATPAKKPATTPAETPTAPAQEPEKKNITVTIGVDCKTFYAKDPEVAARIAPEGVILDKKTVEVPEGSNVYDVMKASGVSFVGTNYLNSVAGLSEGDGGPKAGWLYNVNNIYPGIGIKKYIVKNGDHVQVRYTCDGGPDCKAPV